MTYGAVDLFCGVGGLTCGLQNAGIKVVAGIDLDSTCKYAYEHSNNTTFLNENINAVTGKDIKKLLRGFDVKILVGCAPCQPFSNHQKDKENRQKHKDWSLLYQFARLVKESMPHIVSMENVPELAKEKVFTDFVSTLEQLGYYVSYSVVNAADYGVAQRRRRLILLASKKKRLTIITPTHKGKNITVRQVIGSLPPVEAGEICTSDILHRAPILSKKNLQRIHVSRPNGTWRDWPEDLILPCHKKKGGQTYSSVYGRMSWDGLAPTITTQFNCYGTGRFGHPEQDRALTLREGALIQSFPAKYAFYDPESEFNQKSIARHIGNAVPPRLGEIVGESILRSLPRKRKVKQDGKGI